MRLKAFWEKYQNDRKGPRSETRVEEEGGRVLTAEGGMTIGLCKFLVPNEKT